MRRGQELLERGVKITEMENGSFAVPSLTSNSIYEVILMGKIWVCDCPDFQFREVEFCKHIACVKMWIATKHLASEPKPKVFADDAIQCDRCRSIKVIKYGKSANKQVFKCKDCQHKFRELTLLKKVKFSPELITLTLDLYFSGLSLRKVARNINDHFDIDVNFSTIYTWIQRYIPVISNYVNSLKPQLGSEWHADELFVKMKGGEVRQHGGATAYLWNIMDRESRFLIASKLSEHRDKAGMISAFNEAIHNNHGQKPTTIRTDSLRAYINEFENISVTGHIAKCGINKPHAENNRIERLNGTLRERVKCNAKRMEVSKVCHR